MTAGRYQAIRLGPDLRPTNGQVIAEADTAAELIHLWEPGRVVIAWRMPDAPRKRLSRDSLATVRRKRLRRRLDAKHPLFAAQLYEAEIAARPDYYAGHRADD